MKQGPVIALIAALALLAAFFGYRSWKASAERDLANQRANAQQSEIERHKEEVARELAAQTEAARLAQEKARLESEEARRQLAQLQSEQAAMESARAAAEEEKRKAMAEKERLEKERSSTESEAAELAAERQKAEAEAEAARKAAEQKLAELDQQKHRLDDREASRLAALKHQQDLEQRLIFNQMLTRAIYPNDYKRREHYYMGIDMLNAEIKREATESPKPAPLK